LSSNNNSHFLTQVLGDTGIRSEGEQRAYIESKRLKASQPIPEQFGLIRVDKERGELIYLGKRGGTISPTDVTAANRALRRAQGWTE
jgi:hypothetical protein